jgi:hypothetical protein
LLVGPPLPVPTCRPPRVAPAASSRRGARFYSRPADLGGAGPPLVTSRAHGNQKQPRDMLPAAKGSSENETGRSECCRASVGEYCTSAPKCGGAAKAGAGPAADKTDGAVKKAGRSLLPPTRRGLCAPGVCSSAAPPLLVSAPLPRVACRAEAEAGRPCLRCGCRVQTGQPRRATRAPARATPL